MMATTPLTFRFATSTAVQAMADCIVESPDGLIRDYDPLRHELLRSCIDAGLLKHVALTRGTLVVTRLGVERLQLEAELNSDTWSAHALALARVNGRA